MNTNKTVEYRRTHTADPDTVRVEDDEDGFFRIRMPLASTDEARDGRALERSIVEGWRDQIAAEPLPLFLDHGQDGLAEHRYGALSKVGYWTDPELVERDGALDLEADAVIADADAVDDDVGEIREALAWLRTQAELGMPISSSAGWSEDTGDRDVPGGADLMEGSIVGIPSDPRTTTASADPAVLARAAEAASEDFDAATFLRELQGRDENAPVYEAGDPVRWPSDGVPGGFRHGRVVESHEEYQPPRADEPITTPTDDEFVYEVQPFDRGEKRFEETPIGRRGSDLLPSELAMPKLNDDNRTMSDSTESGNDPDTDHDDEPDEKQREEEDKYDRLEERIDRLEEMNREELGLLREMADGDDEDEGGEDDEDDGENEDEPDEESDVDDESEQRTVEIDGEEYTRDEALERLRETAADDPDPEDPETRDVGDDADAEGEEADEARDTDPNGTDSEPTFSFE